MERQQYLDNECAALVATERELRAVREPGPTVTLDLAAPTSGSVPTWTDSLYCFLPARRDLLPDWPKGPNRMDAREILDHPDRLQSRHFVQFLVNRRTELSFAREDGDTVTAERLQAWFDQLREWLRELFDAPSLDLEFRRRDFTFDFVFEDGQRRQMDQLPDGFASVVSILAEILIREDALRATIPADAPITGVVLIDEIETHLHLDLQERILPFLAQAFPSLQFIVTTHSPAVISSLPGALVFDLTTQSAENSGDLQGIRYGTLMTAHFGIESDFDLDSTARLARLRELHGLDRSEQEELEYRELAQKLANRSHTLALEVWTQLQAGRDRD